MKILYIVLDPGLSVTHATGAATHILSVINGLRKLGADIKTFIAADIPSGQQIRRGSLLSKYSPSFLRTIKRDLSFLSQDGILAQEVLREAESFRPDIIYERTCYLHTGAGRAAKKLGIPILMEMNSPVGEIKFMGGSFFLPLALDAEKRNLSAADAVITVSDTLKNYFVRRGAEPPKVYVLHNAADSKIAGSYHSNAESAGSEIVIGHVSSFANWYRIDILLKAFALSKKLYPLLRLIIVGDGPSRKKLELLARRLGVSDSVTFEGRRPQEEVLDILARQVDIAVSTNISWYGSPTKIFEYGALGKPVIAFRTPAIAEVIEHEKTGLLVSPYLPEELSSAISRLIIDTQLRCALAKNWQSKVLKEHTWENVSLKTMDICRTIIQKRVG